jgi:hypothetical protein
MTPYPDTPAAHAARAWWDTVNLLPDTGKLEDQSAGVVWTFVSRRAKSSLHVDTGDGTCTQVLGKKLWVLALAKEAREHGLVELDSDSMRDNPAGTHRMSAWLACDSFQWCILHPGDTIVHSRDWLHAVSCIGDEDSVSSANYCWLQGTPPLPEAELQPKKSHKRKEPPVDVSACPPWPTPLSIVQHARETTPSSHSSPVQRAAAAALMDDGQTAAVAAAKADTSPSIARRWHKRLKTAASAEDAARSGRPHKTDALDDAAIVRLAQLQPFLPNRQIRNQLVLSASVDTIQRRLNDAGLPSCIAAQKRHYSSAEKKHRLSFAHGYRNWTAEQWEHNIWSDEKTAEGEGRERQQRVHRPDGERFNPLYTHHRTIFAPSCHVFACFCARGPGLIEIYEGKLDGKALRELLKKTVIQTAKTYFDVDRAEEWWFQHDGSPPFRSHECQTWLHNNGIKVLEFPANSPDLNPIENVWPVVGKLIDEMHPTTPLAVAEAFKACWQRIPLEIWNDYAQSMPERCQAVIDANGDATSY